MKCYNQCIEEGFKELGLAIYEQALMFTSMEKLLDEQCQLRIREYQFCKDFNCPPYKSLNETPAEVVDDFSVIEQEMNQYKLRIQNGK